MTTLTRDRIVGHPILAKLRLLPKHAEQPIQSATTSLINIRPLPVPQITNFAAKLGTREATEPSPAPIRDRAPIASLAPKNEQTGARLDFTVLHGDRVQTLKVVGRSPDGTVNFEEQTFNVSPDNFSEELLGVCQIDWDGILTCRGLPLQLEQPGTYIFELQVISPDSQGQAADTAEADPIAWSAPEPPRVAQFAADRSTYQVGEQEQIQLEWAIANPAELERLVLRSLSPEGLVNFPPLTYRFDGQIPETLRDRCQVIGEQLVCKTIPIALPEPGQYNFELEAISQSERSPDRGTVAIAIAPPESPKIDRFAAIPHNSIKNWEMGKERISSS